MFDWLENSIYNVCVKETVKIKNKKNLVKTQQPLSLLLLLLDQFPIRKNNIYY